MSSTPVVRAAAWLAGLAGIALSGSAAATPLYQPDGTQIPGPMGCDGGQPTGLAPAMACECDPAGPCNIGPVCPSPGNCTVPQGACETTLYHEFNDNTCIPSQLDGLDPWQDGSLGPETFTPTCPLTFRLLTRGTARFRNVFGWYNVTGQRPAPADLFPMVDCDAGPGTEVVLDVRTDPRWAGGEIAFFIATPEEHGASGQCAGGDCCARLDRLGASVGYVFYSQRDFNPDTAGADSLVHLIVYDSVQIERKFYFAWEDIYGAVNNDFTDIVTSVTGVECTGGGQACDTGAPGVCQYGVTACAGSGTECRQVYGASDEVCDGADNDCDGEVDENAAGTGTVCSDDIVGNCTGVTCDAGLVCRNGLCIDPCDHVGCPTGQACFSGVCLPGCNQCNGVVCSAETSCDLGSGACVGGPGDGDGGLDGDAGLGGDGDPPGGCCRTSAGGGAGAAPVLVLLVAAGLVRRRRRAAER